MSVETLLIIINWCYWRTQRSKTSQFVQILCFLIREIDCDHFQLPESIICPLIKLIRGNYGVIKGVLWDIEQTIHQGIAGIVNYD